MRKFKPIIALILAIALLIPAAAAAAEGPPVSTARLFVNGTEVATSHRDNAPLLIGGTTFLPITALRPALGADIIWRPDSSRVYLNNAPDEPVFALTHGGYTRAFTPEELLALGTADFTAATGDYFTGVPFAAVLGAQSAVFVGGDGFAVLINGDELLDAYIIFEQDRGTFRLIMARDEARGRWVRGNALEVLGAAHEGPRVSSREISIFADGAQIIPRDAQGREAPPFMLGGMIYLPLRAVADALGMGVAWDGGLNAIFIGDAPDQIDADEDHEFTVTAGGRAHSVTMSAFEALGPRGFYAVARGERRDFTGVPIAEILNNLGISRAAVESLVFTAANGNSISIPAGDALNPNYGFLAVAEGGAALSSWAEGGSGPFRLVLAQDQFPQRWLSNIARIELELAQREFTGISWQGDYFTGVALADFVDFELAGLDPEEHGILVVSTDGFNALISPGEAADAFIAFERNGEPITEDGLPALVMARDERRNRFVRQIASVTLQYAGGGEAAELGEREFAIVAGGRARVVTMDIIAAAGYGEIETFAGGRYRSFTGVSLTALLDYLGIDYKGAASVRFVTADGLEHAWTAEEAFGRGYIAFLENGEPLGERDAPFRGVLTGAPANRWMGQVQTIILV